MTNDNRLAIDDRKLMSDIRWLMPGDCHSVIDIRWLVYGVRCGCQPARMFWGYEEP